MFIRLGPNKLVEHFQKRFKIGYVSPKLLDAMMKHGGGGSFPATAELVQDFLRSADKEDLCLYLIALIHFFREQGLEAQAIIDGLKLNEGNELRSRLEGELRQSYEPRLTCAPVAGSPFTETISP
jgi:hypothetical protein